MNFKKVRGFRGSFLLLLVLSPFGLHAQKVKTVEAEYTKRGLSLYGTAHRIST